MKIRTDFVTNSSSSSFVIATNESPPEGFDDIIKQLTEANILDAIEDTSDYSYTPVASNIEDEELQKLGRFTDEQMILLKLIACDELSRYQSILNAVKNSDKPVYHIFVDRDWLYSKGECVEQFINNGDKIDEKFDL